MDRYAFLALDLGAESGRAVVGFVSDQELRLKELHRFSNIGLSLPSGLHWDVLGLFQECCKSVTLAADECRGSGVPLVSLGVNTWGVDYGLIGKGGELLGLPYCYRDSRTAPAFEKALKIVSRKDLYDATGIQFMPINTLFQLVAHQEADPELLGRAEHVLFMPDLIHYFFTGEAMVESTIASTSQMIDARTGAWSYSMISELGLPTSMLGKIVPPGTTVGTVRPDLASELGVDSNLKVITPGAHDTAAAVAAIPADPKTDWCFLSSGTWSLLGAELSSPCLSEAAYAVPFTNEGGAFGTYRFLKNISGLWLVQECRRQLALSGTNLDYQELSTLAKGAGPFKTLIDTEHSPFASPGNMVDKIRDYARKTCQPVPADPGELIRCCLESLALTYRVVLEKLENVLARRFNVVHIVGGGSRNDLLNQMTADSLQREVLAGPVEATATGNVLLQAYGAGVVKDQIDVRRRSASMITPRRFMPRDPQPWDQAYDRYCELLVG